MRKMTVAMTALAALGFYASSSEAWTATSISSFKSITSDGQCGQGRVTVVSPGVFDFYKPASANRCEAKGAAGITPTRGRTYTIQWSFRLSNTVNNNAVFQWKSYGRPMLQNYPLVLKMIDRQLCFMYKGPSASGVIWNRTSIAANTTHTVRLQILVSDSASAGRVSYWLDGSAKFTNRAARTFDGTSVEPKWGVYGASGTTVTDRVSSLTMN